jgi:monoamine oxidase
MRSSIFASLARRAGNAPTSQDRRRFLAASAAAGAGLLLSMSGCAAPGRGRGSGGRVIVIGAGFAGLACAYELTRAGWDPVVLEARNRVGGRVLSFNASIGGEFVAGRNIEGGGELVGSNHPHWAAYAERFGLRFLDAVDNEKLAFPVLLGDRALEADEALAIYEAIDRVLPAITADARAIDAEAPWLSPRAAHFDARSVARRLGELGLSPDALRALDAMLSGDNAAASARQSDLALLAAVKGGGLEAYWTESEVYRCDGGNQRLAIELARALADRVRLGTPVASVRMLGDRVIVTTGAGGIVEGEHAVLAAPPTVWGKILFDPPLPPGLAPQTGVAVKYLARVRSRFWEAEGKNPDALGDGLFTWTWDGTNNQTDPGEACLTAFSGGPVAERARAITAEGRDAAYAGAISRVFPGFPASFVESRFMDWPADLWTGTGYCFPAPGEVTTILPKLHAGLGRLHFAGEHTSPAFAGYMEGALESGARVARRIARG